MPKGGLQVDIKYCKVVRVAAIIVCLLMGPGISAHASTGKVQFFEQNALGVFIEGGAKGQLAYSLAGPSFNFSFSASKLDKSTNYSLILSREPEVMLPNRYEVIATKKSDSGGNLNFSGSFKFDMDLLSARLLLIPTDLDPAGALTDAGKYLFAAGTIQYDNTESDLICGGNQSPGPSDLLGLHKGDHAINFSLYGIENQEALTAGNAEQPLKLFTLSELLEEKPVLLVNGAFT